MCRRKRLPSEPTWLSAYKVQLLGNMERFKNSWWQSARWSMLRQVPACPCWHPENNPTYQVPLGHRNKPNTSSVEEGIYCPALNCRNQTQSWLTGTDNHMTAPLTYLFLPSTPLPFTTLISSQANSLPVYFFPTGPHFAPLFGICDTVAPTVPALARAGVAADGSLAVLTSWLEDVELLLAQRTPQRRDLGDTPMQEARTEKGSSKCKRKAK